MRYGNFTWRCLVCLLALLGCGVVFSQPAPPDTQKFAALYSLKKGRLIRVEKSDGSVIAGKLQRIKNDSLLLIVDSNKVMVISISDLQTLWARANAARVGGRVGAIFGAIPGAIVGVYMASIANIDCESHCVDLTGPHLIGGAIGGLMGAACGMTIGSIAGAAIPKWERVYP